jgi:limonene-1,2-epoxide hydrolase
MIDAAKVVDEFIAAVEAKDITAAASLLAENVSYENMPMQPIVGRSNVEAALNGFLSIATRVEWPVHRQLVSGNTVMNERLDRFEIGTGWLELPVAGVFEVDDEGFISLWRDYFDLGQYTQQLQTLTG